MKPDIYPVKNIGQGSLSVMAKPVSGEWIDDEFSGIRNAGIDCIVSLLENHEAYEVGLQNEAQLTERHGMTFVSFAIPDRGLPGSLQAFIKLANKLYQQICQGEHTVVHCRAGIGRTGMLACGILVLDGLSVEDGFNLISQKRGVNVPDTDEQRLWLARHAHQL